MKNLILILGLFLTSCGTMKTPYITSLTVSAVYEQDGKTIVQLKGIDSNGKESFCPIKADTGVTYTVGKPVGFVPK